jgi:hypothetical protein
MAAATAAGMDGPRPQLSNDLDEDGVQEIVQRTWTQYMQNGFLASAMAAVLST